MFGIRPIGKLKTTKRPAELYETTLAASELSGVTIICGADAIEVPAFTGFFEAQPEIKIAAVNRSNGANNFMVTVKRAKKRRSIHVSVMIVSLCS